MRQIEAICNAGRWMVYCPVHGRDGAVLALDYHAVDPEQSVFWTQGNEYICPKCYPGIVAQITLVKGGRLQNIFDRSARATARLLARKNDEIFQVTFPPEREQIEALLSKRPPLMRNWQCGESLDFLEMENQTIEALLFGRK